MGNQQHDHPMHKADGLPTLLLAFYSFLSANVQRVIKYTLRSIKAHPVLGLIDQILIFIPNDLHRNSRFVATL